MSRRHLRSCLGAAVLVSLVGVAGPAAAEDPELVLRTAKERIAAASRDAGSVEKVSRGQGRDRKSPEQRIADAVLLMGVKDYERAADVLNRVIEKFPNHPTAYADAMNLLGETYFRSKQYLSAKRMFGTVLDRQNESQFAPFAERAAVRLVDVALRMRDLHDLDPLFAKIGSITSAQSGLSYAKGKGLLAQGKLSEASGALAGVAPDGEHIHQARYLMGVIATQEATPPPPPEGEKAPPTPKGRYAKAVSLFREVTKLPADSPNHRHVIDMAWLAIGRLLYEGNQWTQSVEAYNRIGRESPEFGTMLFELAWVYVRLGDVVRAQRALEVLAVAAPNSQDVADASLLRGDLMLRAGQFEKSRKVYESVRGTYEAMQERLNTFLGSTDDPGVYFDTLSKEQLELFEQADALPTLVVKWAREGEDGERAFAIIDDVAMSRRLIKESNEMIERLNAVLSSPNRIRALPALKKGAERGIGLLNSISVARMSLAAGMDEVSDDLSSALAQARKKRQALERRLSLAPVTSADFAGRERQALRQWNKTSQSLQRLELEINTLQATINGLDRMLKDGPQAGVVRSPEQIQQFSTALVEQRRFLKYYRDQVSQLRRATEAGKVQVGFGDKRFVEDANHRVAYKKALWEEVKLAQAGGGGSQLASYVGRLTPILQSADKTDRRLEQALASIDKAVAEKAGELRKAVRRETANIVNYSLGLEDLDQEARLVVGSVALRNFKMVGGRLKDIVLRADVGITEEAWELREEQLTRVRRL
ncbi:MAG: tetratricopeptide repeat protein, partial [Deltaproteobacteria bacterium]|nr:tetratricopeptide repeat protein [Deltaproteobacteria bacterium]